MKVTESLKLLILLLLVLSGVIFSCSKPEPFDYANPFDTLNPETNGDPFELEAFVDGGSVFLSWRAVHLSTVAEYVLYKNTNETDYTVIVSTADTVFIDTDIKNGYRYSYKVAAVDSSGNEVDISGLASVVVNTDPAFTINGGDEYTSSRQVTLSITAHSATYMIVGNNSGFLGSTWQEFSNSKAWTLEAGGGTKTVYIQVRYSNDSLSAVMSDYILPQPMNPILEINGGSSYTNNVNAVLNLSAEGTNLRVRVSEDSTFTGISWEDYTITKDFTFSSGEGTKTVYVHFINDFEILSEIVSAEIIVDQTSPSHGINSLPDTVFVSPYTISGTAYDSLSGLNSVEISLNNGITFFPCQGAGTWSYSWQNITRGWYYIVLKTTDNTGNVYISQTPLAVYALPVSPVLTTISVSPESIPADGSSVATVKLIPKDYNGNTLGEGLEVTFIVSLGTVLDTVKYSDSDRSYTQQLRSSTVQGKAEVTAEINGLEINNKAEIEFTFFFESEMVFVPEGSFSMGDYFSEGYAHELPVHTVYTGAFYIGKYEVKNEEYKKFIDDGGYTNSLYWSNGGYGDYGSEPYYWNDDTYHGGGVLGNDEFPVVGVSWYEAMAFCAWLSEKSGYTYRLPTEAEWEKAARGTDQRRYPWGGLSVNWQNDINGSYANFENSGDPYDNGLTPVGYFNGTVQGSFPTSDNSSFYDVYDMAGNVFEWCLDWYDSNYYENSQETNPAGPDTGILKVYRGGAWDSASGLFLRSVGRNYGNPGGRYNNVGFRIVRE